MTTSWIPSEVRSARRVNASEKLLNSDTASAVPARQESGSNASDALLQGTLDLLILRILALGPYHGQAIARVIQQRSGDTLLVDHGSLYPALQRLEDRGWIRGSWGTSTHNRRARFYTLTPVGRKQFVAETGRWHRLVESISRVLGPELAES